MWDTLTILLAPWATTHAGTPRMNLVITTGWSLLTMAASPKKFLRSASVLATFMAAPDKTYEGRTRQG